MENLCGEDPQDASSTPVDTDGDGLCNYIDSDDDNDSFIDTDEIMCNSDSLDASSVPIDDDNDGICDALQSDRDLMDGQTVLKNPVALTQMMLQAYQLILMVT